MRAFLRKNPKLTPKMPENSAARLTKSYVEVYNLEHCNQFLEPGKAFLVNECGLSDFYFDENLGQQGLKDGIEWCEIEVMDIDSPPDCSEFYVKAEDLDRIEDPNFKF